MEFGARVQKEGGRQECLDVSIISCFARCGNVWRALGWHFVPQIASGFLGPMLLQFIQSVCRPSAALLLK
jgi:hypothetical protein